MRETELHAYVRPLQRWWWLLLLATMMAMTASFVYVTSQPAVYQAHAALMVGANMHDPNPNGAEFYLAQQLAATYAQMATQNRVREAISSKLNLGWLPDYQVFQLPNSQIIQVQVYDEDPKRAFIVAQELTEQIILLGPTGQEEQVDLTFVTEQLAKLRTSINSTEEEISQRENNLLAINSARELDRTQGEITALQDKLTTLRTNYTTLRATTQRGAVNTIEIVEPARLPTEPTDSGLLVAMLVAGFLGGALAVSGAYLIEYLDDRVKSLDDIKRVLNLTLLGTVPQIGAAASNATEKVVMLDTLASPAVEAYRGLRTNLQFASVDKPLRQILVTSSQAAEGKSFTAANLSAALARAGKSVILIDADLHRPTQHRLFKLINNAGLTTALLTQQTDLDPLLQPTLVPGLWVLPSGPLPPNPAELLGSRRMQELLERLQQQVDVVIIDSPPLTAVVDAVVLSATADGVLLVIRAEQTACSTIKEALEHLQQVKAHVLGAVFNGVPERNSAYYQGEDYGHYQSAYWRRTKKKPTKVPGSGPNPPPPPKAPPEDELLEQPSKPQGSGKPLPPFGQSQRLRREPLPIPPNH